MPEAEEYIYRPTRDGVGSLVLAEKAEPKTMEGDRSLYIHEPPPSPTGAKPGILILMDGDKEMHPDYSATSTPAILDKLYQKEKIPNQVTVFIPPGPEGRFNEYSCNIAFTDFLNKLPLLLQNEFDCSTDRKHTTVGGTSFGGLAATHAALTHPETFGNVLSQSGAFWWHEGWKFDDDKEWSEAKLPSKATIEEETQRNKAAWEMKWLKDISHPKDKLSINFYLSGGKTEEIETPSLGGESYPGAITLNNMLEPKLVNLGHYVINQEVDIQKDNPLIGNHNAASWQSDKPIALQRLLSKPAPQLAVEQEKTKPEESTTQQFRDTLQQMKDLETTSKVSDEMENTSSSTPLKTTPKPPWEKL